MADTPPVDLHPLVRQLKSLMYGVADETLAASTPCPQWTVGDLLDHLMSLSLAFTRAAHRTGNPANGSRPDGNGDRPDGSRAWGDRADGNAAFGDHADGDRADGDRADGDRADDGSTDDGPPPEPSAARLHPQWRSRLPGQLDRLADAWAEPAAWTGTTRVGGVTLPADQMGLFGVNELTMHAWDLARATGQDFAADPRLLEILIGFLAQQPAGGTPGLFGPVVPVDDEEALLDRAVALAGRDPAWRR